MNIAGMSLMGLLTVGIIGAFVGWPLLQDAMKEIDVNLGEFNIVFLIIGIGIAVVGVLVFVADT